MKRNERGLSVWQLVMLALGTVVGGSFFLGSSVAIRAAGPSVLLAFILGGLMVYWILTALSELTVANPGMGSFRAFAADAFGPGTGFVVGWVYWTGMVLSMSSEAAAVSLLVQAWLPGVSLLLLGGGIIVGVTLLNLLGAKRLSSLESGLAAVKLLAVVSFIVLGALLVIGLLPSASSAGAAVWSSEPFLPGGIGGLAGSMLVVMFSYAGFEVIGLAAPETENPRKTVPRAIRLTVLLLTGLYILSAVLLLSLIPTSEVPENASPMVAALTRSGMSWAGTVFRAVLVTAILSTMLAGMFGVGRMLRSLARDGQAPLFLRESADVPRRGILFSGLAMLAALCVSLLFPKVYLFLVSSGGYSLLFTYAAIMASHLRLRRRNGCPPDGVCQMRGFPFTSAAAFVLLAVAIFSMPLVPGQGAGLLAGLALTGLFTALYFLPARLKKRREARQKRAAGRQNPLRPRFSTEFSEEPMPPGAAAPDAPTSAGKSPESIPEPAPQPPSEAPPESGPGRTPPEPPA